MRKSPLVTGQYYHIYNRGVDKRDIFSNEKDLSRFILSMKEFNILKPVGSLRGITGVRHLGNRENNLVSIVCYCLNPNHFHFILKQEVDGGISEFLKRLLGGYSKYFNLVHDRTGALFQGRFKSHLVNKDQYFLKIFPYVNVNYLIHDIPKEKKHLVRASDSEYEKRDFHIVSEKEATDLLDFYGDSKNFKQECINVVSIIREQREKLPLFLEEDIFTGVGHL